MATRVFVFGASGHAKVVVDSFERMTGFPVAFIVDDAKQKNGSAICGYRVIGGRDALLARRGEVDAGIVAIGDNRARAAIADWLAAQGFTLVSAIHPGAAIARDVSIGAGAAVMAGTVINTEARIGQHAIINTGATVDHDCVIGDCVHVAPGCHLCGGVSVGAGTLLGAGTTVRPGVRIGKNVTVGAGSTVLQDIPDGAQVAGSPCRPIS
ncbi:MAG: acetyltransferase [Betaproteobacteria bacterium]|nr:acetyltransferase [Betaproteobacteria bacterium]